MANFQKRKNGDKSTSFVALVRIKGFSAVSKSFPTLKEAEQWAKGMEAELKDKKTQGQVLHKDLAKLTIKNLVEEYLADPITASKRYKPDLDLLCAWWVNAYASERVYEFGVQHVRAARAKLMPGRSPATVNRYLSAMRAAWNWGKTAGLVTREWPQKVMLTEARARVRYLNDEELEALLDAAAAHSPTMSAAILVSLATGVRQSELLRLTWSDVDLKKQTIRVLLSKNNESRVVHLPSSAVDALRKLKEAPVVGVRVFLDDEGQPADKNHIEHRWRAIRTKAGLVDFRWHDLRHSCASFLAQNGATLLEIGSVLGHKSASVTLRYAHLIGGAAVTGHAKLDEKLGGKLK